MNYLGFHAIIAKKIITLRSWFACRIKITRHTRSTAPTSLIPHSMLYLTLFNFAIQEKVRTFALPKHRGVEQWQLVGLITQRSEVRVLLPPPSRRLEFSRLFFVYNNEIKCLIRINRTTKQLLSTKYKNK